MKRIFLFLLMIAAALAVGCSSGGSDGPNRPQPSDQLTLMYCRTIEEMGIIHVQWAADSPTRGEIRYGRTSYTNIVNISLHSDSHDVALAGLEFSTHYVYRLTAYDAQNRQAEYTSDFMTPAKATPEPIISGLAIGNITEETAKVTWRTDEPSTSILYYGLGSARDSVKKDSFALHHEFTLTNLIPSATYRVRPEAVDTTNLRGYGRDTLFATATRMIVSFPDTFVSLGDTIRVPISLAYAQDLAALRLFVRFTPGAVEVVAVEAGPFYTDNRGFIFFSNIRNSVGQFLADLTWSIEYNGDVRIGTQADGSGIVAWAKLRGVDNGGMQATFDRDSSFGLDMFSNTRICSLKAGVIAVE